MRRAVHLLGTAMRESGKATDRLGMTISGSEAIRSEIARHRPTMNLSDKLPVLAADAFVAPNASVIGEVLMLDQTSVWYGAVVRGDKNKVRLGALSNIQDRAVVSTVTSLASGFPSEVTIGSYVTIGQGALLTSCIVEDFVQVGAGAIIEEGSVVERGAIVAPGAVVVAGTLVPAKQLWAGNPAAYIRDVSEEEEEHAEKSAKAISLLASDHSAEFLPFGYFENKDEHQ